MKYIIPLVLIISVSIFSCKKDSTDDMDSAKEPDPVYHVSFYDHKTGEKITGLEASLVRNDLFNDNIINTSTVKSDAKGELTFKPFCRCTNQYLRISTQSYIEALYEVNDRTDTLGQPFHTSGGSAGLNIVFTKLVKKEGNDFYFRTNLYRKAPVDLHIRQVSDFPDSTLALFFNTDVYGADPSKSANIFETHDLLGNGLMLHANKKIDTTIKVFAFGDYLNKLRWGVYGTVNDQWGVPTRVYINEGDLKVKIFPSDTTTSITITF